MEAAEKISFVPVRISGSATICASFFGLIDFGFEVIGGWFFGWEGHFGAIICASRGKKLVKKAQKRMFFCKKVSKRGIYL